MAEATASPQAGKGLPLGPEWRKWAKRSLLVLGITIGCYVGAGLWAVRGDLARATDRLSWHFIPVILGLVVLGWFLRSLRWHYYVRYLQWPVPLGPSLLAFFASFAFTATPGKAGELVKSVLLRTRYNVPLADGAGVLLVERLTDLIAVLLLAAGGLAMLADGVIYFVLTAAIVGGMTLLVTSRPLYRALLLPFSRIHRLAGPVEKVLRLLEAGRKLLQPAPFLAGVGIAFIAWGCEGCAFHLLLRNFGVATRLTTSCSVFGVATVVGALSALPGGLGSFEAVMVLLLSRMGLTVAAATLPVLLFRFFTFWLGSFIGLLFLAGWFVSVPSSAAEQPAGATP